MNVEINNREILIRDFSIQNNIFGGGYIYLNIDNKYLNFIKSLKNFTILSDFFVSRDSNIERIYYEKYLILTILSNDISIKELDIRDYKIGKILHKRDKLI